MPRCLCLVALSFTCCPSLLPSDDLPPPKPAEARVDASLEEMRDLMKRTTVERIGTSDVPREAKLNETPVFRYSDEPKFIKDSTLWIWEDEGRPVAIQKIENNFHSAKNPTWTYCIASLADDRVHFKWPNTPAVELTKPRAAFETLSDGPKASTDENIRERQFREVARMFAVKAFYKEDKFIESFRLLPKPVHEYEAEPLGIVAGKIFGFASGTNPDALLIVELLDSKSDGMQWRFAPVQMTSRGVALFHGERKVWSAPNTAARDFTNWGYKFISR